MATRKKTPLKGYSRANEIEAYYAFIERGERPQPQSNPEQAAADLDAAKARARALSAAPLQRGRDSLLRLQAGRSITTTASTASRTHTSSVRARRSRQRMPRSPWIRQWQRSISQCLIASDLQEPRL
jgi:hypothetical protein